MVTMSRAPLARGNHQGLQRLLQYGDHARLLARVIQRASRASFAQRRQQDSSAETSTKGALQPLPAWPSSRFNITLMCFLAHMA